MSVLLGGTMNDESDQDMVAKQLAKISEQLAIKNQRNKKIWKIARIILLIFVIFNILLVVLNVGTWKSFSDDTSTTGIEINDYKIPDNKLILFNKMKKCIIWNHILQNIHTRKISPAI